jgi:hypothetical protein
MKYGRDRGRRLAAIQCGPADQPMSRQVLLLGSGVGARAYSETAMSARRLALLAACLVVAVVAAGCGESESSESDLTSRQVIAEFDAAGAPLVRKSGPGDSSWDQLGLAEDAPQRLINRYGIFSIYVVEPGKKEAMESLFRDKATRKPLPHRRGIYWELDTHSNTWTAHTRYQNLVLVWSTESEQPAVDARWHRLHRILRDLTVA